MSHDTLMQLRTLLTATEVKTALLCDPALADLGLADHGEQAGVGNDRVNLVVRPWELDEDELEVIPGGFETAAVWITLETGRGMESWEATKRLIAATLRLVPGDVCLADQDAGSPGLLRLSGVVYVDPNWVGPEELTDYGYRPERIVEGIPPGLLAAEAPEAA